MFRDATVWHNKLKQQISYCKGVIIHYVSKISLFIDIAGTQQLLEFLHYFYGPTFSCADVLTKRSNTLLIQHNTNPIHCKTCDFSWVVCRELQSNTKFVAYPLWKLIILMSWMRNSFLIFFEYIGDELRELGIQMIFVATQNENLTIHVHVG